MKILNHLIWVTLSGLICAFPSKLTKKYWILECEMMIWYFHKISFGITGFIKRKIYVPDDHCFPERYSKCNLSILISKWVFYGMSNNFAAENVLNQEILLNHCKAFHGVINYLYLPTCSTIKDQYPNCIETSLLIWTTDQLTGFHTIGTVVLYQLTL